MYSRQERSQIVHVVEDVDAVGEVSHDRRTFPDEIGELVTKVVAEVAFPGVIDHLRVDVDADELGVRLL
jgi:hypothetical protein